MFEEDTKTNQTFWIDIFFAFFITHWECEYVHARNKSSKRNKILLDIYRPFASADDTQYSNSQGMDLSSTTHYTMNSTIAPSMDLSKSIQCMTNIIPFDERLNGEETKPYMDFLEPILDQIKATSISERHKSAVLYSLTTVNTRADANKIHIKETTLDAPIDHINNWYLYDTNIQNRRATR